MSDFPPSPSPGANAAASADDPGGSEKPVPPELLEWNPEPISSSFEQAASLLSSEGLTILTNLPALAEEEQNAYDQLPGPSHGYDLHPWPARGYDPQPAPSFGYDLQQGSTQRYGPQPGSSNEYNAQHGVLFGSDLQPSPSLKYNPQPGAANEFNSLPGSSFGNNVLQGSACGYDVVQGGVHGYGAQHDQCLAPSHHHDGQSVPQPLSASPSLSFASETSSTRRGYRHRHTRQFLQDSDQRAQRTRVLNNEASILYRANMRARYEQVQQELYDLERRNQQLSQRFRELQRIRDKCKRILEAMDVPVPRR
ncbi:uncharacterized protein LOC125031768 [Penaeus chinensis]|uniref:uncharacterized protein LOC125031768 n=1 Tax=Penaeus chinensis TaxID=139456 RepID=UPI001FB65B63|nr:uncharacterized protein LOC125031768 [Penaeus chinensis]